MDIDLLDCLEYLVKVKNKIFNFTKILVTLLKSHTTEVDQHSCKMKL